MTRLILLLALGLTAAPALADISDSGNLTIGGTGVIQGTMTVRGNAFSVGGSTFAVLGGTAQVGGLMRVSSLGIQWNDGSTSTTAAGGGGGNAVLTATQTWSGANTFAGFTAFSTSVVTSSSTYGSGSISESSSTINLGQFTGSNSVFAGCAAGSTVTINVAASGSVVNLNFASNASHSVSQASIISHALMDGSFAVNKALGVDGYVYYAYGAGANTLIGYNWTARFVNVSAGTHTLCAGFSSDYGATWKIWQGGYLWTQTMK